MTQTITKQQAFSHLQDELDVNPGFFSDGMGGNSTTIAGEYLQDAHNVEVDTSFEWAFEWASLPENKEFFEID